MERIEHGGERASRCEGRQARVRLEIAGTVQGVGFRPYVYRLARRLDIVGWVANGPAGVIIEAQSVPGQLDALVHEIENAPPPGAVIRDLRRQTRALGQDLRFEIRKTFGSGHGAAGLLPDRALCLDCRRELFDPDNRRFRYPFIGCTRCGPRYTVTRQLPYDRASTSMADFEMCDACLSEFTHPDDRRFHSQLNCCADCGPRVALRAANGRLMAHAELAVQRAVHALKRGEIVAVKGIGGFHLMAGAANPAAISTLRERKQRPRKPLALMFPDLASVESHCAVDGVARSALESAEAPIVVLRRRSEALGAFPGVAPGLNLIGAMLAYAPLHHLLCAGFEGPLVATSANREGEPLCIDDRFALRRLDGIADLFLVHDREIVRALDDSIVRPMGGRPVPIRRARGYVPNLIEHASLPPVLAVGGHLKNTVALGTLDGIAVSEHLGDLESLETRERHQRALREIVAPHTVASIATAVDLHPDYAAGPSGDAETGPTIGVQHHHAHALACMADNGIEAPVLAVVWDGAGLGTDGTIWRGEFLCIHGHRFERFAHLRDFPLPGGHKALSEPRRVALAIVRECAILSTLDKSPSPLLAAFSLTELRTLSTMLDRALHCPRSTSAGRLFDAVSALLGLCFRNDYEGEAAMALECAVDNCAESGTYPFDLIREGPVVVDWGSTIEALVDDIGIESTATIAGRFHATLAEMICEVARRAGVDRVVLTGGCFQNASLLERSVERLSQCGFGAFWHRNLPPNDGGIAVGQVIGAAQLLATRP